MSSSDSSDEWEDMEVSDELPPLVTDRPSSSGHAGAGDSEPRIKAGTLLMSGEPLAYVTFQMRKGQICDTCHKEG